MAKVIIVCGKLCSGKTTYARHLAQHGGAVVLSMDELMLTLFGQYCGDMHEEYAARTQRYLIGKTVELIGAGVDVILDWGFWKRAQRDEIRRFFTENGIEYQVHTVNVSEDEWKKRIEKRNADVLSSRIEAYYVDENLARKFEAAYEAPDGDETDVNICTS